MRRMLYLGLTELLKELKDESGQPLIRHIDLWNEQVEFIEQEEPFDTPAVFIEFRPVQWRTLGGTTQQADVPFRLHVVTTWKGSTRHSGQHQGCTPAVPTGKRPDRTSPGRRAEIQESSRPFR